MKRLFYFIIAACLLVFPASAYSQAGSMPKPFAHSMSRSFTSEDGLGTAPVGVWFTDTLIILTDTLKAYTDGNIYP